MTPTSGVKPQVFAPGPRLTKLRSRPMYWKSYGNGLGAWRKRKNEVEVAVETLPGYGVFEWFKSQLRCIFLQNYIFEENNPIRVTFCIVFFRRYWKELNRKWWYSGTMGSQWWVSFCGSRSTESSFERIKSLALIERCGGLRADTEIMTLFRDFFKAQL